MSNSHWLFISLRRIKILYYRTFFALDSSPSDLQYAIQSSAKVIQLDADIIRYSNMNSLVIEEQGCKRNGNEFIYKNTSCTCKYWKFFLSRNGANFFAISLTVTCNSLTFKKAMN